MQIDADEVPQQWELISPEWMTGVLQARHPGVKVAEVSVLMREDGTNRRARLGLRYSHGQGPSTVFVKAHADAHREAHLRNGNLWNEARLFSSGVSLPIEHPLVYKAIIDTKALDFLLVMEDLKLRQADPRDGTQPLTVEQVADGMRGLARLHSQYWQISRETHPGFDWLMTWEPSEGWQRGLGKCIPIGMELERAALPPDVLKYSAAQLVELWARYVDVLKLAPVTLLHGDTHLGNTYVLPDGEVGFLDWQVVRRGRWSQDTGYFLISALTEEDRLKHEVELLEIYRQALRVPEDQRPTAEQAWLEYRATPAYGLAIWLSTAGADGYQRREVSLAIALRFAAAFKEFDTPSAVDQLRAAHGLA